MPILLQYCPAKMPGAERFERTKEMAQIEAAGFLPIALITRVLGSEGSLEMLIGSDTPRTVRQYLLERCHEIFGEALEAERNKGAAA